MPSSEDSIRIACACQPIVPYICGVKVNKIAILCDNFTSHRAYYTIQCAKEHDIILIFLPIYSPDLNPIEFIWKSIKRVISRNFVHDIDHMRSLIQDSFLANASKLT
ncbi:MAG: transposase [Methanothrix sp.]